MKYLAIDLENNGGFRSVYTADEMVELDDDSWCQYREMTLRFDEVFGGREFEAHVVVGVGTGVPMVAYYEIPNT